jgi:hypothetical protein
VSSEAATGGSALAIAYRGLSLQKAGNSGQTVIPRCDVAVVDLMSFQPSMTMRRCRQVFAAALLCLAAPCLAGPSRQDLDIDLFASMSGKCITLKVAGRDFACRSVAYFHSETGRANFSVALDDPADGSHVISFSGENARREVDNLYELPIDRMLLNSKDRPKVDGLPVPSVELSAGICRQLGSFATGQLSSIACSATDRSGRKYELSFESDGSPMTVRRIRQAPLVAEKRRAMQTEQRECRRKAAAAMLLPRDWTAYIIQCLQRDSPEPATAVQ